MHANTMPLGHHITNVTATAQDSASLCIPPFLIATMHDPTRQNVQHAT